MTPDTIGRYEVQGLLGKGAFGEVYAARDPALGRVVAIKVLRQMYSNDPGFMDRFRAEATSLAALAHPNVTLIYDLLEGGSQHGMVMELVRGHTLEHVLQLKKQLNLRSTLATVVQAASGLGYVHRMGVVHRDIKPSNLMLTAAGVLKIMDFGIAKVQGAKRLTRDGTVVGTLVYASPEQIKSGTIEAQSDQYSLACVVYEMLCGRPPFEAETEYDLMQAHIAQPPEALSGRVAGLPAEVNAALMRALAKNPAERFESVERFAQALGAGAVQLDAGDIARELVESTGPIAPLPVRAPSRLVPSNVPSGSVPSRRPEAVLPDVVAPIPVVSQPSFVSKYAPFMAMGGAAVVALAVGLWILFGTPTPGPVPGPEVAKPGGPGSGPTTQVAKNTPPPPAPTTPSPSPNASGTTNTTPQKPPPVTKPAMPNVTDKGGATTQGITPPVVPPVAKTAEPEKPTIAVAPSNTKPTTPAAVPAPDVPTGPPSYQGKVIAWLSGSTIVVRSPTGNRDETLHLYGVRDLPTNKASEMNDIRNRLEALFAQDGQEASCWTRFGNASKQLEHQCYIAKKDMGRWAVERNLAKPTSDAPPEYRATSR